MPAPNSILKPTKNPFAPVDKTYKIYRKCLEICLKLPKRYTFLVSQNFMDSAHNLRKFAKGANSIMPTNKHEVQARRDCWLKARIYLQNLSAFIDDFLYEPTTLQYHDEKTGKTKGVAVKELEEIADLLIEEGRLITNTLKEEKKRYSEIE